jgi:hypothetical protein
MSGRRELRRLETEVVDSDSEGICDPLEMGELPGFNASEPDTDDLFRDA